MQLLEIILGRHPLLVWDPLLVWEHSSGWKKYVIASAFPYRGARASSKLSTCEPGIYM